jgi:hypothetical protein
MNKCLYKNNNKDLELLYNDGSDKKDNYIIDVKKIDNLGDVFTIKTIDAELNKTAPIEVDDRGAITKINISISNKGRYYDSEPPKIIIEPPASSLGTQATATVKMKLTKDAADANNNYWEIDTDNINITGNGSGYDAVIDKDKISIEKKSTAQKKIVYNENKPKYYLLEQKASQCNNLTDRWHNWFSIPYYYLGNNDGRRKADENDRTRKVFKCYDKCNNKYVVNNDNVCESIQTFEGGKYRNYIPYDPLAIICILGSIEASGTITATGNIIKSTPSVVEGNYYHTIQHIKAGNDEEINTDIRDKILISLSSGSNSVPNHPVKTIETDITAAYDSIVSYINGIITNAERDELKIKTIIKNDVNNFYQLFDKRDELYISYLNKLKDSSHFKRILYAKSIAHQTADAVTIARTGTDANTDKYIKYLFKYCKFLYFNKNNMFAIRLLNYGIYDTDYIKEGIANPDEGSDDTAVPSDPVKINYNPVAVKIDAKHKNIFDDYSNAYELYKSFILTYPVILLLSVILFVIIMGLYWGNVIYLAASFLNFLYVFVIGFLYGCIVLLACNGLVISLAVFIVSTTYKAANLIYSAIMTFFGLTIVRIILLFMLITALINNNFGIIYGIVMYFVNTIIYFILGIIYFFLHLLRGIIYLKSDVIIPLMFILPILYVYYKIWFNFDINTLDKDIKKGTKIINEHSNITTIIKSGSGTAISTARLELYKHSYFMNLYKNAFENYAEKIEEIEGYNKSLLSQEQEPQQQEQEPKEELKLKLKLNEKNKELEEKVNDSNIFREQIKSKKKELKDFNSENDDKLRDLNKDIYKNMFKMGDKKTGDAITAIKDKKKDILDKKNELLDKKEEIKKGLSDLKSKENEARSAIKNIGVDMKDNFISRLGKKLPDMQNIKKLGNIVNNNIGNKIGDKIGDKIGNIIDKVKI